MIELQIRGVDAEEGKKGGCCDNPDHDFIHHSPYPCFQVTFSVSSGIGLTCSLALVTLGYMEALLRPLAHLEPARR